MGGVILSFSGAACDPFQRFWPACLFLAASAAWADSRVFIIANQADGYGVDQCLAKGEKCGAHAARSYCQSRNFAAGLVLPPGRSGRNHRLGSEGDGANCGHAGCDEYIAITCQR